MDCSSLCVIVCTLLLTTQKLVLTLTVQDFFPFGLERNDTELPREDDKVESVELPIELPFFGKVYSTLGVSSCLKLIRD